MDFWKVVKSVRWAMKKPMRKKPAVHVIDGFYRHEPCGYCGAHAGVDNGEMRGYPSCKVCMGV